MRLSALIPIDRNLFAVQQKVSIDVQRPANGKVLDIWTKLTMKVKTDGSISPDDAWPFCARILQRSLGIFRQLSTSPNPHRRQDDDDRSWNSTPLLLEKARRADWSVPFGKTALKNDKHRHTSAF